MSAWFTKRAPAKCERSTIHRGSKVGGNSTVGFAFASVLLPVWTLTASSASSVTSSTSPVV